MVKYNLLLMKTEVDTEKEVKSGVCFRGLSNTEGFEPFEAVNIAAKSFKEAKEKALKLIEDTPTFDCEYNPYLKIYVVSEYIIEEETEDGSNYDTL